MEIKAWKKIGEPEVIAKKHSRSLVLQKFENPYTNTVAEYSQFGTINPFACIVMSVTKDGQVLAVRQYRHGADRILVELPGGNPKTPNQPPEDVAKEELFEESFGYIPKKIIKLNPEPLWFDPASCTVPFHAFLGIDCTQSDKKGSLDRGEYIELVKIPLEQWVEMCCNGQISDSKSITVTFLSLKHL